MISLKTNFDSVSKVIESPEWLETNGIGGYASGTVAGIHTRRYHGHLIAATRPPVGRSLILAQYIEHIVINGERIAISSCRYENAIDPDGCLRSISFRLDPFPIWRYDVNGVIIERELFMVHGINATVVRWCVIGGGVDDDIYVHLLPLVAFRDHHHLQRKDEDRQFWIEFGNGVVAIGDSGSGDKLTLDYGVAEIEKTAHWYENFDLEIERERGFDHTQDLFQPFSITLNLNKNNAVIASVGDPVAMDAAELRRSEIERRARIVARARCSSPLERDLVLAADHFIVSRGNRSTVIAGYPWFGDWGRDTMIALPGIAIETGRLNIARQIIEEFSEHISEGMIPNRFPDDSDRPDYNTVDASLWYFEAIRSYIAATNDLELLLDGLYDKLADMIEWQVKGTRYGIRVDTDGLLRAGEPGTQLTWMDAKIGDEVITPRIGKPVEIQALWYNALLVMAGFADELDRGSDSLKFSKMAAIVKETFAGQFWNPNKKCLYDVIVPDANDHSIRPNQIFAVSLHHQLIGGEQARSVVDTVERELLTPYGLRSLSTDSPDYSGQYIGSPYERDSAYHQGTVWGWLLGHFAAAYQRTHTPAESRSMLGEMTEWIEKHLNTATLGSASEIFDGDAPHTPRGCGAQAWTVAEYLRILRSKPDAESVS